jgi:hypothetical protein
VVVFNTSSDSFDFYVDNSSAAETVFATGASGFTDGSEITIGSTGGTGQYTDGIIDEVGIWEKALTSGEVSELYNSGSGLAYDDIVGGVEDAKFLGFNF